MKTVSRINKARAFAAEAHKDTRYGDLPFTYHLDAVVKNMGETTEDGIVAARLHDVVEDTPVTLHDIREAFGGNVARLVDCVTDEPGKNRKERKAGMYKKLAAGPPLARRVKLADRIANMEASIEGDLALMYIKEFPEFIRIAGVDEENNDLILRLFRLYITSVEARQ
jgi:(p)ppGpp synthase/HD superfamily hydrolase